MKRQIERAQLACAKQVIESAREIQRSMTHMKSTGFGSYQMSDLREEANLLLQRLHEYSAYENVLDALERDE